MKDQKSAVIGVIVGAIVTLVASLVGLQIDDLKAGICQGYQAPAAQQVQQAK